MQPVKYGLYWFVKGSAVGDYPIRSRSSLMDLHTIYMGSRDRVGPIDARTRIRNALLKKCNEFEVLITIPHYEWDEVQGRKEKEEEYVKRKVMGE